MDARERGGEARGRGRGRGRGRDKQQTGLHFLLFCFFSLLLYASPPRLCLVCASLCLSHWSVEALRPHHSERCVGEGKTTTQQGRRDQGRRGQCARVNLVYYLLYQITTRVSSRIALVRLPGLRGRVLALCVMYPFGLGRWGFWLGPRHAPSPNYSTNLDVLDI